MYEFDGACMFRSVIVVELAFSNLLSLDDSILFFALEVVMA